MKDLHDAIRQLDVRPSMADDENTWDSGFAAAVRAAASLALAYRPKLGRPPSPLANVLYDLIDDCFEKGRTPTPEEIEPFLRPKVKALVWNGQFAYPAKGLSYCMYAQENGLWVAELEIDDCEGPIEWQGVAESRELAQAAAQSHWERRASELFKEAFE